MNKENATCFMLEDLRRARYSLRRYSGDKKCSLGHGYHDAKSGLIEERPEKEAPVGDPFHGCTGTNAPEVPHDDPRWPQRCACGYEFQAEDTWQVWADGLYRRQDTGEVLTWAEAPGGATRDASWWPEKGADGHGWLIKLPSGEEFMTENKAGNCQCPKDPAHRCWTRSGVAPKLTVNPSIATPKWHGWLRDGVLTSC